jgi:hypothetical protein
MSDPLAWMNNLLGTGSDMPVRSDPPQPSTPVGPLTSQIATANVAVTVFAAGSIAHVADIVNPSTATEPLYVDIVAPATAGSATSIPLIPGQAYRVSTPISTPVTAVAATAGHVFIAVGY